MNVLLAGATGYVGSATADKLLAAGHTVTGLARSDEAAAELEGRGIGMHRGDFADPESVARGAERADGIIYAAGGDPAVLEAIVGALSGSGKPFAFVTGALVYGDTGEAPATEERPLNPAPPLAGMAEAERAVLDAAERGVRSSTVRAAFVHGRGGGAIPNLLLDDARKAGAARYVGDGENRWAAVHVDDLAELFVLALEKAPAGTPFNAVAENVSMREAAESVARALGVGTEGITPEEASEEWGFFAEPLAADLMLSGERAEKTLGWTPSSPSLFEDLERGSYRA